MTRQQRRFQARQTGKQQLISEGGPFFYGAFHKDDKMDGFAFTIDSKQGPQNSMLIKMLLDTHDNMIESYNDLPDEVQDDEILFQKDLLKRSTQAYNAIVFPEGRKGFVNLIPQEAVEHGITAATAIHFLTTLGHITNDEYNGMHFLYDNVRVDIVA